MQSYAKTCDAASPPDADLSPTARVERHLPEVLRLAGFWQARHPYLHDEIASEAMYRLWLSARSFEPARGTPFKHYAFHNIKLGFLDVLKLGPLVGPRRVSRSGLAAWQRCPVDFEEIAEDCGPETYLETVEALSRLVPAGRDRDIFVTWHSQAGTYLERCARIRARWGIVPATLSRIAGRIYASILQNAQESYP